MARFTPIMVAVACGVHGCSPRDPGAPDAVPSILVSIRLSPEHPAIAEGATLELSASGAFSDGSTGPLPSSSIVWSSSDPTIASVSTGVVTGLAPGVSLISASLGPVTGTTMLTVSAQVVADAAQRGAVISKDLVGSQSPYYLTDYTASISPAYQSIPISFVTYGDDYYHWQSNTYCQPQQMPGLPANEASQPANPNGDFDHFMTLFAQPAGFDVMIHVPIGTNPTCTGRADPSEAAAWVDYANNQKHYGIRYWQLGLYPSAYDNGDFGTAPFLSSTPALYASIANQFIAAMKASDPAIQVGVYIAPQLGNGPASAWDAAVLPGVVGADFVTTPIAANSLPILTGNPSDQDLLFDSVAVVRNAMATMKSEITAGGRPDLPIIVDGLIGNEHQFNTQQISSIVTALYLAQALAEVAAAGGVAIGPEALSGCSGGFTAVAGEYGFQTFAIDGLVSQQLPQTPCPDSGTVAAGTILPAGRAFQLAAAFATPNETMLGVTVGGQPNVRAYAATHGSGFTFFLFNLDENSAVTPSVGVGNISAGTFDASIVAYGKAQYDQSQNNVWAPPASQALGTVSNPFNITLPPWSMTVLTLSR